MPATYNKALLDSLLSEDTNEIGEHSEDQCPRCLLKSAIIDSNLYDALHHYIVISILYFDAPAIELLPLAAQLIYLGMRYQKAIYELEGLKSLEEQFNRREGG